MPSLQPRLEKLHQSAAGIHRRSFTWNMQHFVHSAVTQDVFQEYTAFFDKTHQSLCPYEYFHGNNQQPLRVPVLNATVATDGLEGE